MRTFKIEKIEILKSKDPSFGILVFLILFLVQQSMHEIVVRLIHKVLNYP